MEFQPRLFLGFCVEPVFQQTYSSLSHELKNLFVQNGDAYLQEHFHEEKLFIGKFIDGTSDVATLELLSLNIFSLLKKLVPEYPYHQTQLRLIPVIDESIT